jgi:hypothetical protein
VNGLDFVNPARVNVCFADLPMNLSASSNFLITQSSDTFLPRIETEKAKSATHLDVSKPLFIFATPVNWRSALHSRDKIATIVCAS